MALCRIIPCLDVDDGRVVKGVKFSNLRDAGSAVELAQRYEEDGADELVMLDVSATPQGRSHQVDVVKAVREVLSIPLTVGGGIRKLEDAMRLLDSGADKVSLNTAAVRTPGLITELANRFGCQCTVVAIDAAQTVPGEWEVVISSGKERPGLDAIEWVKRVEALGAGEILLTSWDRDGTRSGYDLSLLQAFSKATQLPVIASGGADTPGHMLEAIEAGADAVLAASIFHDGDWTVWGLKDVLHEQGLPLRRKGGDEC